MQPSIFITFLREVLQHLACVNTLLIFGRFKYPIPGIFILWQSSSHILSSRVLEVPNISQVNSVLTAPGLTDWPSIRPPFSTILIESRPYHKQLENFNLQQRSSDLRRKIYNPVAKSKRNSCHSPRSCPLGKNSHTSNVFSMASFEQSSIVHKLAISPQNVSMTIVSVLA